MILKHHTFLKISLSAVFTALILTLHVNSARAQQNDGLQLTMSPTTIEVAVTPGQTLVQKFRIHNNGSLPEDLSISVDKLDPHTQNGQVVPVAAQPGDTTTNWLSFDSKNFTAPPQEWTDITMTITIPSDATLSNYFAVRVGQSHTSQNTPGIGAKLLGEIVLPVLVNVKSPNAKTELQLLSFAPATQVNEYLPVVFNVVLKNTGNTAVTAQGNIFIRTGGENDIATLDVNPGQGIILPDGTRTFQVTWDDGFLVREPVFNDDGSPKLDSHNRPITQLVLHWDRLSHFRIGNYPSSVLMVYDNGTRDVPLEAKTTFWVFPYTIVASILLGFVVLILLIRFALKLYIANEIKKHQVHE